MGRKENHSFRDKKLNFGGSSQGAEATLLPVGSREKFHRGGGERGISSRNEISGCNLGKQRRCISRLAKGLKKKGTFGARGGENCWVQRKAFSLEASESFYSKERLSAITAGRREWALHERKTAKGKWGDESN